MKGQSDVGRNDLRGYELPEGYIGPGDYGMGSKHEGDNTLPRLDPRMPCACPTCGRPAKWIDWSTITPYWWCVWCWDVWYQEPPQELT